RVTGRAHRGRHGLEIESAHSPFILHLREEEPAGHRCQRADPVQNGRAGGGPPALHDDLAAVRVHRRYHAVAWEGAAEIRARRGADHDSCRAGIEPGARRVEVANATADAARCPAHHLADQPRVRALAERGVEVDDRHLPGHGELLERSEEHTSELQSLAYLVCRLLLEKKKNANTAVITIAARTALRRAATFKRSSTGRRLEGLSGAVALAQRLDYDDGIVHGRTLAQCV